MIRFLPSRCHPLLLAQTAVPVQPESEEPGIPASPYIPLVGRTEELKKLLNIYHSLTQDGHLVIIEGETGIGKTRLAEEFLAHAQGLGAGIVQARCFEGERNLTYGPVVEGLRRALAQVTRSNWLEEIPATRLSEVSRLLPELHQHRTDLHQVTQLESPGAQSRFFEAIHQFLLVMFQGPNIGVFFIDDLQWADTASLELFNYLARRLSGQPIFILTTYRREEFDQSHPLQQFIAHARRSGHVTRINLERLNEGEVRRLADTVSEGNLPEPVSQRLFRETEGLPFFLVEYLLAFLQKDRHSENYEWALPGNVRDLLLSRLAQVTETGSQLLTTAAVIGRSFGFETLREASGRDEEETISGLENLVAKGLIEEVRDSGDENEIFYDFRHEKLRSLVYEETSAARRRLLHRRVAEALVNRSRQTSPPARLAGQIAYHFRLGGRIR
jgi:predicted ATPase